MNNFINEHMNILILIGVSLMVLIYLANYYIRSSIDAEIMPIKKRIKKLQSIIQPQSKPEQELQTSNQLSNSKKLEFSGGQDESIGSTYDNENENMSYEKSEIDADSYFDPTHMP